MREKRESLTVGAVCAAWTLLVYVVAWWLSGRASYETGFIDGQQQGHHDVLISLTTPAGRQATTEHALRIYGDR